MKYIPNYVYKTIYDIDFDTLYASGKRIILSDLDNTIAAVNIKTPSKEVIELFKRLEDMNFKIIIFSNAFKKRIAPFKEKLNIDASPISCKPFKKKYLKIMSQFGYKPEEIAAIGDQLFTDIKGANKLNITSILVNPLSKKESIITKFNRLKEKRIYKKLSENKVLIKGEYYE